MFLHPLIAPTDERADRGRRGVENVHAVLLNDSPEAVRFRPIRRAFIHEGSRAIRERTINDVAVPGYPSDVRRAPKNIFVANIEHVFCGRIDSDQITAGGVEDSFRLPGRTAGVKDVKRMFAIERCRWTIVIDVFELAMPPDIAAFFHVDLIVRALENNHAFHRGPDAERVIHIFLKRHNSAPAITPVCGDQCDRAAVMDPVAN